MKYLIELGLLKKEGKSVAETMGINILRDLLFYFQSNTRRHDYVPVYAKG